MRFFATVLVLLLLAAPDALAHTRSQSQSRWTVEGDTLAVQVEADAYEVTRLYALGGDAPLAETFAEEAARAFSVSAGGSACAPAGAPAARMVEGGRVIVALRFDCPAGALSRGAVELESRLFLDVAPSHLHFVALRDANGATAEAVLTDAHRRALLQPAAEAPSQSFLASVGRFVPVGAEHVWTGLDHVAFILALVLLTGGSLRRVVLAATGFTLGHTATLGFATMGVLRPDTAAIEALIGFTIAFVALEAGEDGAARLRAWSLPAAAVMAAGGIAAAFGAVGMSPLVWFGLAAFAACYPRGVPRNAAWLAAAFGLIHGCGFAGALAALDLPKARLLASLLGFNLGVELGQVAVIAAALGVGAAARRAPPMVQRNALALAGAALFALGTYWFIRRL